MSIETALQKLAASRINLTFADTADKDYQVLQSYRNVTSYSMQSVLHTCPRKFQLIKARAASGGSQANNVDFAYGHSVGSGIQAWLSSGGDMKAAIFNAFLAWKLPYGAEIEKKHKSIWDATIAVQKYAEFHQASLEDWAIWILPNGKPAIELSVEIDFENGYKHYMHIDVILQHRYSGKLAVQENKTHGFKAAEAAIYANSGQALSYAVAVDMLADVTEFEVFYMVYSAPSREWEMLPFRKTTALKAEWITDTRIDHSTLETYHQLNFYPKRGESCYNFMRRCEFFGTCGMTSTLKVPELLPPEQHAERVDYSFTLSQIIAKQHARNDSTNEQALPDEGVNFESID